MHGYSKHDANDPHCGCWSCHNDRQVKIEKARRAQELERALAGAAELRVSYTKDGEIYRFEHQGRIAEGALKLLLPDPTAYEKQVVDLFLALPLYERGKVLERARKRGGVRVGDIEWHLEKENQP